MDDRFWSVLELVIRITMVIIGFAVMVVMAVHVIRGI